MRLLFVSDTHLGLDLPSRPRVERRRRGDDLLDALERALAPALAGGVDAVLHGGDLHYRSRVPFWLARAALEPLLRVASRGVPVLLVPGNHERSRLPFPLLALHERLHVFDRPRTFTLEARGVRVAFSGFPYAPGVRDRFTELVAAARGLATGGEADVRVLCLHQCVEGATCGPGNFTFRDGDDVVRRRDLPADVAAVLSGHVHRHQILRAPGLPSVVYAGSVERVGFAEVGEEKGAVRIVLERSGLASLEFLPHRVRPMLVLRPRLEGLDAAGASAALRRAVSATPGDAVVQLRLEGTVPAAAEPALGAASLRALGGGRTLSVSRRGGMAAWPLDPERGRGDGPRTVGRDGAGHAHGGVWH